MVGKRRVKCLMFADDVVLLADTEGGLQESLRIAWDYARKWGFGQNPSRKSDESILWGWSGKEGFLVNIFSKKTK